MLAAVSIMFVLDFRDRATPAEFKVSLFTAELDPANAACDHLTQIPEMGAHQITVTNPGGSGNLGLCEKCSADAQCGSDGDNCVFLDGDNHCFTNCREITNYSCSAGDVRIAGQLYTTRDSSLVCSF